MIISQNCFYDKEIKSIIKSLNTQLICEIKHESDLCINSEINQNEWVHISEYLHQIKDLYSSKDLLPNDFPEDKLFSFPDLFIKEWKILNPEMNIEQIDSILKFFFRDYKRNARFGNRLIVDKDYLEKYGILGESNWKNFVVSLKHRNRFHSNFLNSKVFENFCRCFEKHIPENAIYLRGRIAQSEEGFKKKELNAPPDDRATTGRANAEGISRLYLADSQETVLKEVRAGVFDYVSIAEFKSKRMISVVDFTALDEYSPFSMQIDMQVLSINKENLENINIELGKPMRRTDNLLDYVPTQYLIDFIESIHNEKTKKRIYDGVMYKSVMNLGGINLVIFEPSVFKQQDNIKTIKVSSISYNVK